MKMLVAESNTKSAGLMKTQTYTIQANSKMFDLLSSGLYTKKIEAIIRELSSNAIDAHKAAGFSDTPYQMQLPNSYNNYTFKIRDFGTGLSYDDVMNLYTTYGMSNKDNSNDFIGGMGLGSKSPFCYVDRFTIVSYFNKMKYVYISSKDEDGNPQCNYVNKIPTEEPNGLEITLIAKNGDNSEFISAYNRVQYWQTSKCNIIGSDLYISKEKYKKQSGFSRINSSFTGNANLGVWMGEVFYPVNADTLIEKLETKPVEVDNRDAWEKNAWQNAEESNILVPKELSKEDVSINEFLENMPYGLTLVLHLNIGDVNPNIGREGIQMTAETKKVIRSKILEYMNSAIVDFQNYVNKITSYVDACRFIHSVRVSKFHNNGEEYIVVPYWDKTINYTYNGKTIRYNYSPSKNIMYYYRGYDRKLQFSDSIRSFIYNPNTIKVVVKDINKAFKSRIERLFNDNGELEFVILDTQENCDTLIGEYINREDLIKLSSLATKINYNSGKLDDIYVFNRHGTSPKKKIRAQKYWSKLDDMEEEEFEQLITDGGYYVPISSWEIEGVNTANIYGSNGLLDVFKEIFGKTKDNSSIPVIYGVRKSSQLYNKIVKSATWKEYTRDDLKKLYEDVIIKDVNKDSFYIQWFNSQKRDIDTIKKRIDDIFSVNNHRCIHIQNLYDKLCECQREYIRVTSNKSITLTDKQKDIAKSFGLSQVELNNPLMIELDDYTNSFDEIYPLADSILTNNSYMFCSTDKYNKMVKNVARYIELIDNNP